MDSRAGQPRARGTEANQRFTIEPNAVVVTALATYRGFNGFMDTFPATGRRNAGSRMYPIELQQKCYCGDFDAAYGHIPDWITRAFELHQRRVS